MATTFADGFGDFVMAATKIVDQTLVAISLLNRPKVGPLDIFNQGEFKHRRVIQGPHQRRHLMQACTLRRSPAALTGNNFITVGRVARGRPHQNWL